MEVWQFDQCSRVCVSSPFQSQGLTYVLASSGRLWSTALRMDSSKAEGAAKSVVRCAPDSMLRCTALALECSSLASRIGGSCSKMDCHTPHSRRALLHPAAWPPALGRPSPPWTTPAARCWPVPPPAAPSRLSGRSCGHMQCTAWPPLAPGRWWTEVGATAVG